MQEGNFGPNTKLINELSRRLQSFPWFTRIETPHPDDERLVRVKLAFLLEPADDPWNGEADAGEMRTARMIMESSRISEYHQLQSAFRAPWSAAQADAVQDILLERHPDYKDTYSYGDELLDFPEQTIRGALYECLVDDMTPRATFFRDLLPWFEEGYWPCGWEGKYPKGKLVLL